MLIINNQQKLVNNKLCGNQPESVNSGSDTSDQLKLIALIILILFLVRQFATSLITAFMLSTS